MDGADTAPTAVETLSRQVEQLVAKDAIRTCLYRINRGLDRIDPVLLRSGFFADAKIRWASEATVDFDDWLAAALAMQQKTQRVQHMLGNILIELDGEWANVESYEIGRHLTSLPDGTRDLVIAARYVDIFERRAGEWRISRREKVIDWIRILQGDDPLYDKTPLKGLRTDEDRSLQVFGADAFHSLV